MDRFLNADTDPNQLSSLTLAFIGDGVYELFVREMLVSKANYKGNELHTEKIKYVSAAAQAEAYRKIESELTEEEIAVFKRGRNAHTTHTPKNMSNADYHTATGFEALWGYLYLKNDISRLQNLFKIISE